MGTGLETNPLDWTLPNQMTNAIGDGTSYTCLRWLEGNFLESSGYEEEIAITAGSGRSHPSFDSFRPLSAYKVRGVRGYSHQLQFCGTVTPLSPKKWVGSMGCVGKIRANHLSLAVLSL